MAVAIFEALRAIASQYAPNVWQLSLGLAMLAIIIFLPAGLWSLAERRWRSA
jgi:ABC-type branched-subunit amino acid transport system permease subunit